MLENVLVVKGRLHRVLSETKITYLCRQKLRFGAHKFGKIFETQHFESVDFMLHVDMLLWGLWTIV